jgi:chorismate dehydratase
MMPEGEIRLAAVSYLNTRPLIDAFERQEIAGYRVIKDVPSRLPALVETGQADLGLIPAGYCASHPELFISPGAGIACHGAVASILLVTRGEVAHCRRIATTTESMTSVRLLAVLLKHHFKVAAELSPSRRPLDEMAAGRADGALLIGDPALQARPGALHTLDLGTEWASFTGLPFVFALWAGKDAAIAAQAAPDLVRAMESGRLAISRLAQDAAPELGLPVGLCEEYLDEYIVHHIGAAEMRGYERFCALLQEDEG